MDIEEVAHDTPEKIVTFSVDPATGIMPHHGRRVAKALGLTGDLAKQAERSGRQALHGLRREGHGLLEINPLIVSTQGELICLDAKVVVRRQRALSPSRHRSPCATRPKKTRRKSRRRNTTSSYITLDGTIGCMVNGAGLAMATMDIIKLYGEEPANFLDVGGGATKEKVTAAFKIITADPNVKGILVNIFGGIMSCDVIARASSRRSRKSACRFRWSSASKAPMSTSARRSFANRVSTSFRRTISTMPRRKSSRP